VNQSICGIDIGGANLKFADNQGHAHHINFPMWKNFAQLSTVIAETLKLLGQPLHLAITMTGELADCFLTKQEGIETILTAIKQAVPVETSLRIWQTSGEFVSLETAIEHWSLTASANWHALATWSAQSVPQARGLLIDIGSTTTDVIPLEDGLPCSKGLTDQERLMSGELLYLGVSRTPVFSLAPIVPSKFLSTDHDLCLEIPPETRIAAEFFATMADVYLLTGDIEEQPENTQTADGRPLLVPYCLNRLAHQFCCDLNEISENQLRSYASFLKLRQIKETVAAIKRVLQYFPSLENDAATDIPLVSQLIISGEGEFLIPQIFKYLPELNQTPIISLNELLGPEASSSACAYALAKLAEDF
jgi:probable H4MPT-linked C1 transfer pathway protein